LNIFCLKFNVQIIDILNAFKLDIMTSFAYGSRYFHNYCVNNDIHVTFDVKDLKVRHDIASNTSSFNTVFTDISRFHYISQPTPRLLLSGVGKVSIILQLITVWELIMNALLLKSR
jgi:hypothetical protein